MYNYHALVLVPTDNDCIFDMNIIRLFALASGLSKEIASCAIPLEKQLQTLFEENLESLLNVSLLASEQKIADVRIDTLGLDQDNCPVIIEYKRNTNVNVITQGQSYLYSLSNHKDTFKLLVLEKFGSEVAQLINWSACRVVCVASDYTKHEIDAAKLKHERIELLRYHLYGSTDYGLFMLENLSNSRKIHPPKKIVVPTPSRDKKTPKKAVSAARILQRWFMALENYLFSLGDDVLKNETQGYVAYKRDKNIVCVKLLPKPGALRIIANLNPDDIALTAGFTRNVSKVGHFGTGDVEIIIKSDADLDESKPLLKQAYVAS